jgi:hypothetical protein
MMRKADVPTRFRSSVAGAALLIALSSPAFAGDYGKEVSTASDHAGYAAISETIADAHAHLHQTINCLVGPTGAGFDATVGNPCQSQGDGAMADTTDAGKKQVLENAVTRAQAGLASDDLGTATSAGADVQAMLEQAL